MGWFFHHINNNFSSLPVSNERPTGMEFTSTLTDRTRMGSEPASPTDRVFQFISDPRHKENLSGRVRAACITCRRKKIKCSGEINCRTCQEKGVVCEGLPDRKRPKRNSIDSNILDPLPAGVDQVRKLSTTKKASPKQRPGSLLKLASTTKSNDSGYSSLSPATSGTFTEQSTDTTSTSIEDSRAAVRVSPAPFRVDIWELGQKRASERQDKPANSRRLSDPADEKANAEPSPTISKRNSAQSDISWWSNNQRVDSKKLSLSTTAARVVFGDSMQPARTKPPRPTIDLDGMPFDKPPSKTPVPKETTSRRQTVQFPISTPLAAGGTTSEFDILANQPGIFDDMALLLASRAPGTGATPGINEFSSWWDINTDISSMLGQAGQILKEDDGNVVEHADLGGMSPKETDPPRKRPVPGNFYW